MAETDRTAAVVLAAGDGKRLRSDVPKVLHDAAGRPLIVHVLAALEPLHLPQVIVVTSPRKAQIEAVVTAAGLDLAVDYAIQETARGTGDATRAALDVLRGDIEHVVVLAGDGPLIRSETIADLMEAHVSSGVAATMLTAHLGEPTGYGRIIRDSSQDIERIVEERDADARQRAIQEVNCGGYAFEVAALRDALPRLTTENAQHEYYLTATVEVLLERGLKVGSFEAHAREAKGVNSRAQLAEVAAELRLRACERWMEEAVTIVDPNTTYIDSGVTIGRDTVIYPFTFLEGTTSIAEGARIGPQVRLVNAIVGPQAEVSFSVVRDSEIGEASSVGPFASLRPGTRLGARARVGTFVETKQAQIGDDSKANHLAYLGDARIGRGVNVGAGTITCNWDGHEKHETVIDDDAYIGSDTMLIAPAHVGKRAATGAGSVVRGEVPDDALAVGVPAKIIKGKGDKMGKGPSTPTSEPGE